jgi:uncharacterized protein (TIGR03083 family)
MSWATTDVGGEALLYVEQIRADVAVIAAAVRSDGMAAAVDHCPGWTVAHVVQHLGEVHRWATEVVRTGAPASFDEREPPASVDTLVGWFEEGAATLCRTLDETDPERACWTFGFPPERAGFWRRRQAYETAVHCFDVVVPTGHPFLLDPAMAAHGVAEVATFMFPRQVALERTPALHASIELRTTDTGDVWSLGDSGAGAAQISGRAVDLLLMLWGRPHDAVERTGDPDALAAFDAAVLVP